MEVSIEKAMELNDVSTDELRHALYAVKVALDQSKLARGKSDCDCEVCKENSEQREKMMALAKMKYSLGLMDKEEEEMYLSLTEESKEDNEIIDSLQGFYDKMSGLLPQEAKDALEAQSEEMMRKVIDMKSKIDGMNSNKHI